MRGFIHHLLISLKLNFRNPMAVVMGYLLPIIFLLVFRAFLNTERYRMSDVIGQLLTISILDPIMYQAQRQGISPNDYALQLQEAGGLGTVYADVRRGKALAAVLSQAAITDASGNLWVRSPQRLFELPRGSQRFIPQDSELRSNGISYGPLYRSLDGRLMVAMNTGLAISEGRNWRLIDSGRGLAGDSVANVLRDREGSLWIGLHGTGLMRWLGYHEWESWTKGEGLSSDMIWAIRPDASGKLLLVNPSPGQLGNLGLKWIEAPSRMTFDMNLLKRIKLAESKEFELRMDAINVLNHPIFDNPNLNINSTDFGRITTAMFAARTFVLNARVNF